MSSDPHKLAIDFDGEKLHAIHEAEKELRWRIVKEANAVLHPGPLDLTTMAVDGAPGQEFNPSSTSMDMIRLDRQ